MNENAFMSVSVEECNNPMASTKQETYDNTIEKTLEDSHVPKSGDEDGGCLNGFSHFGNDSNATKENVKIDEPVRVSTNNATKFIQEGTSLANNKEIIGVGVVFGTTLKA